jgi:hypothetical protein
MSQADDSGFLSRWSRRKVQARQGVALEEVPAPTPEPAAVAPEPATALAPAPAAAPVGVPAPPESSDPEPAAPTLADVQALTRESDFSRFVSPGVDGEVKNAALKKLFTDPHFNVMDGLDTYIDDYSEPDPLPLSSVRKMAQAAFLGLIEAEPPSAPDGTQPDLAVAQVPKSAEVQGGESGAATPEPDEDADLRLQSHDAAGCRSAEDSAAGHERRQS